MPRLKNLTNFILKHYACFKQKFQKKYPQFSAQFLKNILQDSPLATRELRRSPDNMKLVSGVATMRSEFGLDLDLADEAILHGHQATLGGPTGRLERIRTKIYALRKSFRTGWRAAEGAWVAAGIEVTSAFSRAVDAPRTPIDSPLYSFLSVVTKGLDVLEGGGDVFEGGGIRKKPLYRSPSKGGLRQSRGFGGKSSTPDPKPDLSMSMGVLPTTPASGASKTPGSNVQMSACYKVAKTHRMPYLHGSFSAKEPCN